MELKDLPSGFILFASCFENESDIDAAIQYCKDNGYTQENVKIVKNDEFVLVKVK